MSTDCLSAHPVLQENPALIPGAVEEFLRVRSNFINNGTKTLPVRVTPARG
ncbi:hypothetical protein [Actinoplanes couchii]|uniref:Uncharacterized protein n=1 Tax=Actinoplanes couchii TaxID=403638 RepID=A0ABQ3X790_9ACTN|nr:hypothetical protein [Actinoplanes couchii]MDR6322205.1 hypothetical protein [Actinoplanes couchii]GID54367.1 hypothetical protein Aco03nite_027710 [Actinoplanes couchii]